MKVLSVVGARPNFMKVAPIHRELEGRSEFTSEIVHTGQHYDERMSDVFFEELGLPEPDRYLGVGSGSHAHQTAAVMTAFEDALRESDPELVLVVGDVNSTLAAALVAQKRGVPVGHVEAGLRSFDRSMPEEVNRVLTDRLANHLFVTEESGVENLKREGVPEEQIHLVGNVMIDSLETSLEAARERPVLEELGVEEGEYVAVTLHRPSNVDHDETLRRAIDTLTLAAETWPVVFPAHPRTQERLRETGLERVAEQALGLLLIEPLSYVDFLRLMEGAGAVLTDSGGIQEETTALGVPCLTLRDSTERPATVETGTNELVKMDAATVLERLGERMTGKRGDGRRPPLWDGNAAERIVDVLERECL